MPDAHRVAAFAALSFAFIAVPGPGGAAGLTMSALGLHLAVTGRSE